jgi:DNA-binding MarR family transcriptional regulator
MLKTDKIIFKDYIKQLNIALNQANDIAAKLQTENKKLKELIEVLEYKQYVNENKCRICGMSHEYIHEYSDHSFVQK